MKKFKYTVKGFSEYPPDYHRKPFEETNIIEVDNNTDFSELLEIIVCELDYIFGIEITKIEEI